MAKEEIMGLRDWRLSERHRKWGGDCPACDIDFVLAEYDFCDPKALVEYKHCNPSGYSTVTETASVKTIRALGNKAGLPAWVAIYRPWSWSFKVYPLNVEARTLWGGTDEYLIKTETEYVETLYRVRGRALPDAVRAKLNQTHDTLPGQEPDFDFLRNNPVPTTALSLRQARQEVWNASTMQ